MAASNLPNPTDKTVIILKGECAGQEGYCLGPAGPNGSYAVTLTLRTGFLSCASTMNLEFSSTRTRSPARTDASDRLRPIRRDSLGSEREYAPPI